MQLCLKSDIKIQDCVDLSAISKQTISEFQQHKSYHYVWFKNYTFLGIISVVGNQTNFQIKSKGVSLKITNLNRKSLGLSACDEINSFYLNK